MTSRQSVTLLETAAGRLLLLDGAFRVVLFHSCKRCAAGERVDSHARLHVPESLRPALHQDAGEAWSRTHDMKARTEAAATVLRAWAAIILRAMPRLADGMPRCDDCDLEDECRRVAAESTEDHDDEDELPPPHPHGNPAAFNQGGFFKPVLTEADLPTIGTPEGQTLKFVAPPREIEDNPC